MNIPSRYELSVWVLENQTPISSVACEAGTTTTNVTITDHDLETNDFMINDTKKDTTQLGTERGSRRITKVDSDNFTISPAITGQVSGNFIQLGKFIDRTEFIKDGSLRFNLKNDNNSIVSFTFLLEYNLISGYDNWFYQGQYIRLKQGSNFIFSGCISELNYKLSHDKANMLEMNVKSGSLKTLLNRRTIRIDYDSGTATDDIIDDMIVLLSQEGLVSGTISTGIDIESDWKNDCISIWNVIEICCNKNGFQFIINHDFTCDFVENPSSIVDSPYVIEDGGIFKDFNNFSISDKNTYFNKIFTVGSMDNNGNQVFTINGSLTEQNSRQNLVFGTGVSGKINRDITNTEFTEYTAETTTSSTNLKITGHPFSIGDYLYNWDREQGTFVTAIVDVNNVTVESVSGQVIDDLIIYYTSSQLMSNNELKKCLYSNKIIKFSTNTLGFEVRQKLKIQLSKFNIDSYEYYNIENVDVISNESGLYKIDVIASLRNNSDFSTQGTINIGKGFFEKL